MRVWQQGRLLSSAGGGPREDQRRRNESFHPVDQDKNIVRSRENRGWSGGEGILGKIRRNLWSGSLGEVVHGIGGVVDGDGAVVGEVGGLQERSGCVER